MTYVKKLLCGVTLTPCGIVVMRGNEKRGNKIVTVKMRPCYVKFPEDVPANISDILKVEGVVHMYEGQNDSFEDGYKLFVPRGNTLVTVPHEITPAMFEANTEDYFTLEHVKYEDAPFVSGWSCLDADQ